MRALANILTGKSGIPSSRKIGCRQSIRTLSGSKVWGRNAGDSYSAAQCHTAKCTVATHKPTTFETTDWCYIGILILPYPIRHPLLRCLLTDSFVFFSLFQLPFFYFIFSLFRFMFCICIYCFYSFLVSTLSLSSSLLLAYFIRSLTLLWQISIVTHGGHTAA